MLGERGDVKVKKKGLVRHAVSRVIMGPSSMFSLEMITDEEETWNLKLWGILAQEGNPVSANDFRKSVELPGEYFLGCIKKESPSELTRSKHWTETGYLSFGDAKAGGSVPSYFCQTLNSTRLQSFQSLHAGTFHDVNSIYLGIDLKVLVRSFNCESHRKPCMSCWKPSRKCFFELAKEKFYFAKVSQKLDIIIIM